MSSKPKRPTSHRFRAMCSLSQVRQVLRISSTKSTRPPTLVDGSDRALLSISILSTAELQKGLALSARTFPTKSSSRMISSSLEFKMRHPSDGAKLLHAFPPPLLPPRPLHRAARCPPPRPALGPEHSPPSFLRTGAPTDTARRISAIFRGVQEISRRQTFPRPVLGFSSVNSIR